MSTRSIFIGAAAMALSLQLGAQSGTLTPPPAGASGSLAYDSAFDGYRPFEAGEVQDWRQSNDTVRDVGGWRAYARERQAGPPPPGDGAVKQPSPPARTPGAAPAPADPHAGHHR